MRTAMTESGKELPGNLALSTDLKILVVEDNPDDVEIMLHELSKANFQFSSRTVRNKHDFIEALKTFSPDVIYCDYHIQSGFTAIDAKKIINQKFSEIPFIIVTGALNEEVAAQCMAEGIDDYVLKRNVKRLPVTLINALGKRKAILQKKEAYDKLVQSEMLNRKLASHLQNVLEEERTRIAREIHDEMSQQLTALKMDIAWLKKNQAGNNVTETKLAEMSASLEKLLYTAKKISTELRPAILDIIGLAASLQWLAGEYRKKGGLKIVTYINEDLPVFSATISTCFFRVCQEALTNIFKHADADFVSVNLQKKNNYLILEVNDNGKGMELNGETKPFSMGLLGMQERADSIGAHLKIESTIGKGTHLQLTACIL